MNKNKNQKYLNNSIYTVTLLMDLKSNFQVSEGIEKLKF